MLVPGEGKPWKLEVVNSTGQTGVAQRATDRLRAAGYDVVDFHSRPLAGFETCTVIDRVGDQTGALDVAEALGLATDRVVTKVDRSLYVDVTVVIGYDARMYPILRTFTEKGSNE